MRACRSYCKECKREWIQGIYCTNSAPVSISGNPPNGNNCPVCGSPEITDIYFDAEHPGLDIPRDSSGNPTPYKFPKPNTLEVIPGLTNNSLTIREEPPGVLMQSQYKELNEKPPEYMTRIFYGE